MEFVGGGSVVQVLVALDEWALWWWPVCLVLRPTLVLFVPCRGLVRLGDGVFGGMGVLFVGCGWGFGLAFMGSSAHGFRLGGEVGGRWCC